MIMGGAPNAGAQDWWKQASFTYKFYLISSSALFLIGLLVPAVVLFFIDIPAWTTLGFQIWRLFFSFYGQMSNPMSILSILFSFMWMHRMIKDDEASTVYKLFEVIVINLEVHLLLNLISIIVTWVFSVEDITIFIGFGWFNIILVYEFRDSIINPEAEKRFCCLPFLIKSKYFPWVILALFALFSSSQFFCLLSVAIVGYYQQVVRREMLIKLPLGFYQAVEGCLPKVITSRADFVKISSVTAALVQRSCGGVASANSRSNRNQGNPFENSENLPNVVTASNGHTIGGSNVSDFKSYWAQKDEVEQPRPNANPQKLVEKEVDVQDHYGNQKFPSNEEEDTYGSFHSDQKTQPKKSLLPQMNKKDEGDNSGGDLI